MKINVEVDISPKEVKELFEGNMELLQRSMVEMFMRQMSKKTAPDNATLDFWKQMAEKSTEMMTQYQQAMTGKRNKSE